MIFAIDCRHILDPSNGQFGGISEYTDGLVRALLGLDTDDVFVLFFSDKYSGDLISERPGVKIVQVPARRGNFFFNHFVFPGLVASRRPDVFFAPYGQLPLGWRGRAVITVHDLAIYDHPEWFPGGFSRWFSTKFVVPRSLQRAEKIVSVSEATKRDMVRFFKISSEKISAVYPAAAVMSLRHNNSDRWFCGTTTYDKYFLCLGTIEPRKNFILAARAMKIFHKQFPDYRLLVVGKRGWKFKETINEFIGADFIKEIGYVSPEEKYTLLTGARALIFTSLYEGFGLPPLEAMTLGTPVITTSAGALPEVCGQAVRYVSADDPAELVRAMSEMVDEKTRQFYIERGKIQAENFNWEKTAKKILEILHL